MVTSPLTNAQKICLEPLFDNMLSVCDKKNVACKEQEQVCRRENNMLKEKNIFTTWYIMVLPMWVHISMAIFTSINLLLNLKGASCLSSWEKKFHFFIISSFMKA